MEIDKAQGCESKINTFTTIAAGVVIVNGDKVLLVKEKGDPIWKLPGGCIRDHENFVQVAKREAREETGLAVEIENGVDPILYSFHKETPDGVVYYTLIHYPVKSYSGELEADMQRGTEKLQFYDFGDLPNEIGPNVKPVLIELGYL